MGIRKDIKTLKKDFEEVKSSLDKSVIAKAKKMDDMTENLSKVQFKVQSIKNFVTETGEEQLKIEYEVPTVYLQFDADNNIVFNPQFYAINMLDLISASDMAKIGKAIEKAKVKKSS